MRIRWLLPALLLLTACQGSPVATTPEAAAPAAPSSVSVVVADSARSSLPAVTNDVSLPALMRKTYDGGDLTLGDVLDTNSAYTRYTITYRGGGLTLSGIMNIPVGDGPFPVLVLNHGFIEPSVYTNGRGLKREQDYLARRGYVVVHPDYRNHAFSDKDPDSETRLRIGYTEDVINAIEAVKKSGDKRFDTQHIGMLGHSMGGGVTLNTLVVRPDLVDAAVLFAPVSADAVLNYNRWLVRRPEVAKAVETLYGSPEKSPEFWRDASAKTFFDRITAPVLVHHGDADADVPVEWSRDLDTWLFAAGKEVTYDEYPGERHEFGPEWGTVMQRTVDFFDRALKPL